jgi:6-phosphogluconate dehydrogenase
MKIGFIGLGRMGANLAENMRDNGFDVAVYNRSYSKTEKMIAKGFEGYSSIEELASAMEERAVFWIMVPAGDPVDQMIEQLRPFLKEGDIVVDGGNSLYKDTVRRYNDLKKSGVHFADAGTSGGTAGARHGACIMFGGDKDVYDYLKPVLAAVCVENGEGYMGPAGAGHFVKMVHNGIEYGIMQAIGEGFEILEKSSYSPDLEKVAGVWNNGSIIESYLMGLAEKVFADREGFESITDKVDSSGEGLWTVEEALRLKVPVPVLSDALFNRYDSVSTNRFAKRTTAALRNQFGDHPVHRKGAKDD